jgi:hypothetical protein
MLLEISTRIAPQNWAPARQIRVKALPSVVRTHGYVMRVAA